MKKILLGIAATAILSLQYNVKAQTVSTPAGSGFYIDVNAGYNMPMAPQSVGFFGWNTWESGLVNFERTTTEDKYDDVVLSLGKGANFGANIGYMFTKNLGAELGINYLLGSKSTAVQKRTDGTDIVNQEISAKIIQLSPTFVLRGNYAKINPYAKAGLVFGLGTKVKYV